MLQAHRNRVLLRCYLSSVCGSAVKHVGDAAMQPGFAGHIVMPAVDEFIEHVRVIASEAQHLLLEARVSLSHQILKALIPQLASMNEGTWHSLARRFDDVLGHRFGIERRQLAVPVDNTTSVGGNGVHAAIHRLPPQLYRFRRAALLSKAPGPTRSV